MPAKNGTNQNNTMGDFNRVLEKTDTTGHYQYNRALAGLVQGFSPRDTRKTNPGCPVYTHYSPTGATRIDRIYASHTLFVRKMGAEVMAAAFTDNLAMVLRLTVDVPIPRRGRGIWRMKTTLMREDGCKEKLRQHWILWKSQKRLYPESTTSWGRYVKKSDRSSDKTTRSTTATSKRENISIMSAFTTFCAANAPMETNCWHSTASKRRS